ncbi:hypothetical protein Aab01nite_78390 [Paractinoplanes abujensis]|uniref:Uncharacterized protein n=1 Tax=Paractinoplanes abujensis TaxID=882441 RepID=A0A7W7CSR6_9ACTN|nr:hypothetical protein [Actinoplanes abujensis]MBB4692271.1 hypothetical protein [Actinoplanes abujensis]GID24249.1 hypothetical protein Aab01nite_78390 [Actinoplanes abujensis]
MSFDSALSRELQALRSRKGVCRAGLYDHLGLRIRRLCGLTGRQSDARTRAAVEKWLTALADTLLPDQRQAVLVSFAVDAGHRLATLDARIGQLAGLQKVSSRTARRLADAALEALVAAVDELPGGEHDRAGTGDDNGGGWRVSSLSSLFRLDTATPELYEMRTIVATREIAELVVRITLPPTPPGVGEPVVTALFGAHLRKVEHDDGSPSRLITLDLARPLATGESHEVWLHVALPPGQPVRPHYAIVPLAPCETGSVRVRFAADRRPEEVWLLDEVAYPDLDARRPRRTTVEPDLHGEVFRAFRGLHEGHAYGIAWTPPL